jgi:hypothetical protein
MKRYATLILMVLAVLAFATAAQAATLDLAGAEISYFRTFDGHYQAPLATFPLTIQKWPVGKLHATISLDPAIPLLAADDINLGVGLGISLGDDSKALTVGGAYLPGKGIGWRIGFVVWRK